MDTFHLRIFQRHVRDQCQFLIAAAQELNAGLEERNTTRMLISAEK